MGQAVGVDRQGIMCPSVCDSHGGTGRESIIVWNCDSDMQGGLCVRQGEWAGWVLEFGIVTVTDREVCVTGRAKGREGSRVWDCDSDRQGGLCDRQGEGQGG